MQEYNDYTNFELNQLCYRIHQSRKVNPKLSKQYEEVLRQQIKKLSDNWMDKMYNPSLDCFKNVVQNYMLTNGIKEYTVVDPPKIGLINAKDLYLAEFIQIVVGMKEGVISLNGLPKSIRTIFNDLGLKRVELKFNTIKGQRNPLEESMGLLQYEMTISLLD